MMRYEEANLSRMLHKADKAGQIEAPTAEMLVAEVEADEVSESADEPEASEVSAVEDTVIEEPVIEEPVAEEYVPEEPAIEEPAAESMTEESITGEPITEESHVGEPIIEEPIVEQPATPRPRKHAINERRPAIPNDLFAAWFEEQDNQKSQEDSLPEEVLVEQPIIEPVAADVSDVSPAVLAAESAEEPLPAAEADNVASSVPKVLSKEDEKFCRKLERIVHTRMHNPNLNVDVIAAQFGMGRTNFYRKVREITSMSPNDYLRQCRMERASELLRTTDLSVVEICGQVGISDAQYFSRVFKSFYGAPPSAYREQQ